MKAEEMTPEQLRKYSGEHLLHELKMFWWAANVVDYLNGYMHDAVFESFVLHLRNLIEFFCLGRGDNDDSVIAKDFLDHPAEWKGSLSPTLDKAKFRANKELSHLTTERKYEGDPDKVWDNIPALVTEIERLAAMFAKQAADIKLDVKVREFLKSVATAPRLTAVFRNYSHSTNTTTASVIWTSGSHKTGG